MESESNIEAKSYLHQYRRWEWEDPSECRVYIKPMGIYTWIGFENLGEGLSVTNASELLATAIVDREDLSPTRCKFFEWYPEYEGEVHEVSYRWNGAEAFSPSWKYYCDSAANPFMNK
jgi:hypothetical protein